MKKAAFVVLLILLTVPFIVRAQTGAGYAGVISSGAGASSGQDFSGALNNMSSAISTADQARAERDRKRAEAYKAKQAARQQRLTTTPWQINTPTAKKAADLSAKATPPSRQEQARRALINLQRQQERLERQTRQELEQK